MQISFLAAQPVIYCTPLRQGREAAKPLGALAGLSDAYWVNKELWIKA